MTFSLTGIAPGSDATLSFAAHYEMLRLIKHFACGQLNQDSYTGTGNGQIKRLSVMADNSPEETWTVTCTTAATDGGTFSVVGSTSGATADATVGTFYDNGFISFIVLDGAVDFIVNDAFVLSSTNGVRTLYQTNYSGAGNGKLTRMQLLDKVAETWTLTCTAASVDGGTFSVTGSVSGAQSAATVGSFYDNGIVQFLINDSTTDFAVNDVFTLTANTQELPLADRWEVLHFDDTTEDHEVMFTGNGIVGIGPVYAGLRTTQDIAGDYYNLAFATMEGYVSSNSYAAQPKFHERTMPLWQFDVPYWIRITQRQFWLATNVENLNDLAGSGFYNCYYDPGVYPYPAFVCGSLAGLSTTRYDNATRTFGVDHGVDVLWLDGTYKTPDTLPYDGQMWSQDGEVLKYTETTVQGYSGTGNGSLNFPRKYLNGAFEVWTITAIDATTFSVFGSISGVQANATVGVLYDNGLCIFTIEAGGTAFVASDAFTVTFDRQYSLEKIILNNYGGSNPWVNYGELEGVHMISGFGQSAEDTVVDENSDVHVVLSSINRTGFLDYATLKLD
ncbi:hypothetical protein OAE19_05350 [Porticoccaceae bacterium]|nr:hypothetical protein [Porticoccaceae bacterium]